MPPIPTKSKQVIDDQKCGEMMRGIREAKGLSLREVIEKLGFSKAYLSDLELGRRKWNPELVENVSRAIKQAKAAQQIVSK